MAGVCPITQQEVESWQRQTQRRLSVWENETLMLLDDTYRAILAEDESARAKRQT